MASPLPCGVIGSVDPERPHYDQEVYVADETAFAAAFSELAGPEEIVDYDTANLQFRPLVKRPLRGTDIRRGAYHAFAGADPYHDARVHGIAVIKGGDHVPLDEFFEQTGGSGDERRSEGAVAPSDR